MWIFHHESGQTTDVTDSFLDTNIEEDSAGYVFGHLESII